MLKALKRKSIHLICGPTMSLVCTLLSLLYLLYNFGFKAVRILLCKLPLISTPVRRIHNTVSVSSVQTITASRDHNNLPHFRDSTSALLGWTLHSVHMGEIPIILLE